MNDKSYCAHGNCWTVLLISHVCRGVLKKKTFQIQCVCDLLYCICMAALNALN